MLSHDCPQFVRWDRFGIRDSTRTSQALQTLFEIHQPDLWVYGHHHIPSDDQVGPTRFKCLAELETMWIQ